MVAALSATAHSLHLVCEFIFSQMPSCSRACASAAEALCACCRCHAMKSNGKN